MTELHPTAARGFDAAAELYERARPSYPAAAVDYMIEAMSLADARTVVDLGAGTGKFTRELVSRGIACVAVEPVEGMRAQFASALPDVTVLDGTASAIPFEDSSVDAIAVAQAFHWFANDEAVCEMARVLKPGGTLGLVWNARDDSVDWVAEITAIFARYEGDGAVRVPRHRERAWRAPLERSDAFTPAGEAEFPNTQRLTPDGLVERFLSVSFIAVLPPDEKARAVAAVRALLADHPALRGRAQIEHPYITEAYVFRRA